MSNLSPLPRLQFSLRWLLAAMAIAALLLGILSFSAGQILVGICLFVLFHGVLPTAALVGAIYARGDLRACAIGVLVPCIPVTMSNDAPWDRWGLVFGVALHLTTIALCGGTAVVLRRRISGLQPTDIQ
jgi:hypothetical protein